jgi:hypothetical protein
VCKPELAENVIFQEFTIPFTLVVFYQAWLFFVTDPPLLTCAYYTFPSKKIFDLLNYCYWKWSKAAVWEPKFAKNAIFATLHYPFLCLCFFSVVYLNTLRLSESKYSFYLEVEAVL